MNREFWLDGFNFFHHWDSTKGLLRSDSGYDIVRALDRSLRILSRHLGHKTRYTVVYLDGGLDRREGVTAGMRVRYCGPGRKADDRLADDVFELGQSAKQVTAVSNDRELKARLRALGASCLGVGEFLATVEGKGKAEKQGKGGKDGHSAKKFRSGQPGRAVMDEVMREKCRTLSESEVNAWLEFFGVEE